MASLQNAALLLLLALAVPCVALADNGSCEGSSPDYSYLALTLQWPLSNGCSDCGSDTPWTIHGMWPTNRDGNYPCFCGGSFDPSAVSSIEYQLSKAWPSYQGSNEDFWSHEYEKHGTCATESGYLSDEFYYFNNTLTVYYQLNVYEALAQAGITPGSYYSADSIQSAIRNAFGYTPQVSCQDGQLTSIAICFDRSLQTGPCPNTESSCGSVSYPGGGYI